MENAPALSVLIPFFNEEGNVHPVIDEVHAQLAGIDFEIVCVNDCSADATERDPTVAGDHSCETLGQIDIVWAYE